MGHRPNSAERTNAILKAIEKIKLLSNKGSYTTIPFAEIVEGTSISKNIGTILIRLGLIKRSEKGNLYVWNYGVEPVNIQLASKVYEALKAYHGGKRNKAKPVGEDVTTRIRTATSKKGNGMKLETKRIERAPTAKTRMHFDESLGIIFGYKQLGHVKKRPFPEPITVTINDEFTILNVKMITYTIEKSQLLVTFYSENDINASVEVLNDWKTSQIKLHNTVLGFTEGTLDGKELLKIRTIPVSDPFNIH